MAKELICTDCLTVGRTKRLPKGSFGLELALWFFGLLGILISFGISVLIPVFYSVWRLSSYRRICKACGSERLVPTDSPRGRELADEACDREQERFRKEPI